MAACLVLRDLRVLKVSQGSKVLLELLVRKDFRASRDFRVRKESLE
jgi:hypothetical protein